MKKHYNIPIFIPEAACPHQCIFCNQKTITKQAQQPAVKQVVETIDRYLTTIPSGSEVEIAFFGGNFTGLPKKQQEMYLQSALPYLKNGKVKSIRCSTRPDYINDEAVTLLKTYNVQMVELGAQSFDDAVLQKSGRKHTVDDTYCAVEILKKHGMPFGLQMMTGLPLDTSEKSLKTAQEIIRLKANNTRIYPCLVIKGTVLEQMFLDGEYQPQTIEEAVSLCADLTTAFEKENVKILRVGLHRSEDFDSGKTLAAGPYHMSFKELVETALWKRLLMEKIDFQHSGSLTITAPQGTAGCISGHEKRNRKWLEKHFQSVRIVESATLQNRDLHVDYC